MHQDSLKSTVFRSFVACDDPKGVVECGIIRKSKINSEKKDSNKIESRRSKKEKEKMVSKGITDEFRHPSSLPLLEISRGAQKLTRMIDSWSKNKESKDVAKDLLKGALDLQESLALLKKMQEASKHKEKLKRENYYEEGVKRVNSYHFGDQSSRMGFEMPRISVDGPSRDCYEDLRKAIRDSLGRQNLLSKSDIEQKVGFYRSDNLDLGSDIPSTSSSQSSITRANNYSSSDSPFSTTSSEKKAKGSNLIAKLMGLEDIPSKQTHVDVGKESKDKILNQGRNVFDIDMSNARKHEIPERRTLKEILETRHFKEPATSNPVKEAAKSYPNYEFNDDNPPIVLIRPLRGQLVESEETLDQRLLLKKVEEKGEYLKSCKTSSGRKAEESPLSRESEVLKIKRKGPNKTNSSVHQLQKMEATVKKTAKSSKEMTVNRKAMEKEVVKSVIVSRSQDQSKATATKVRKPERGSNVSKNPSPLKQSCTKSNTLNRTKKPSVDHALKNRKRIPMKREKAASETTAASSEVKNVQCSIQGKEDKKMIEIDVTCQNDSIPKENNNACTYQNPEGEELVAVELQIEEHPDNSESSLFDSMAPVSKHEENPKSVEVSDDDISDFQTDGKGFRTVTSLKALLCSNESFLTRVEELFNLGVSSPITCQTSGTDDPVAKEVRISMDCADELIGRRSISDSKTEHPLLLNWLRESRLRISLNQLLDEICNGIETLRSYVELADENVPTVSLYAILEKDKNSNRLVNAIWDSGWRYQFSGDEIEEVVNDIEKIVLSGLIDEVITQSWL